MSGTQKPHFAIDLNEIERQLAQAQSAAPTQPSPGGRHDPLAELARIVGQDDPFEALLASEAPAVAARRRSAGSRPFAGARRGGPQALYRCATPAEDEPRPGCAARPRQILRLSAGRFGA